MTINSNMISLAVFSRQLMMLAPHLVHPLRCLMPVYGHGFKGKEMMWLGLRINALPMITSLPGILERAGVLVTPARIEFTVIL